MIPRLLREVWDRREGEDAQSARGPALSAAVQILQLVPKSAPCRGGACFALYATLICARFRKKKTRPTMSLRKTMIKSLFCVKIKLFSNYVDIVSISYLS